MWNLRTEPVYVQHRAALDRAERALAESKAIRARLAALNAAERRPTLIGVAPSTPSKPSAPALAACLGPRPDGRRSGVER